MFGAHALSGCWQAWLVVVVLSFGATLAITGRPIPSTGRPNPARSFSLSRARAFSRFLSLSLFLALSLSLAFSLSHARFLFLAFFLTHYFLRAISFLFSPFPFSLFQARHHSTPMS